MVLASSTPGSAIPTFRGSPTEGSIAEQGDGRVLFQPSTGGQGSDTYIFGHSRVRAVDWAGAIVFLGVLAGVFGHGGLRVLAARRRSPHTPETCAVYMYGIYERLWHWLQTGLILLLIFTGLVIHRPDMFGIFSFSYIVLTHNVLAGILVINAALAAFYHLASGEIRQYLPKPTGFFGRAFEQAIYYTRGIFRGEIHPFEKTPDQKLNPLQQITYLGLLNVLLPLQVITGALMWGAQQWPDVANRLGGLPLLAPIHTLIAWLFASFVVMHVYLTTTGPTPLASIRGMVMGWDEVEAQAGD
jgi:thiosulfate reductase cytochrome b subunit